MLNLGLRVNLCNTSCKRGLPFDIIELHRFEPCLASQVDTKDILFICGGAFIDLDRQVSERTHEASLGFGNPVRRTL